jgi:hypothetical protein
LSESCDLKKALELGRAYELSDEQSRVIEAKRDGPLLQEVNRLERSRDRKPTYSNKCSYCGYQHAMGKSHCKAFGKSCTLCGKKNHFESVCKMKPDQKPIKPIIKKTTIGQVARQDSSAEYDSKFDRTDAG